MKENEFTNIDLENSILSSMKRSADLEKRFHYKSLMKLKTSMMRGLLRQQFSLPCRTQSKPIKTRLSCII